MTRRIITLALLTALAAGCGGAGHHAAVKKDCAKLPDGTTLCAGDDAQAAPAQTAAQTAATAEEPAPPSTEVPNVGYGPPAATTPETMGDYINQTDGNLGLSVTDCQQVYSNAWACTLWDTSGNSEQVIMRQAGSTWSLETPGGQFDGTAQARS